MPDMQFCDLTCGQIFTAVGILYIKTDVGMSAVALTGPTCGQAKTLLPTDFVELQRVLSLAEIPDSLLMWAHYAESHRGFVVGFDGGHPFFDQRKHPGDVIRRLQRVHYSSERPAAALLNPSLSEQEQADLLASHFWLTKSRDWEYEKEWRMLCSKDDASEVLRIGDQDVCLYSVPESAMTDVVLGCQMTAVDRARLLELRSEQRYAHITWSAACVDANHFRINIRPI